MRIDDGEMGSATFCVTSAAVVGALGAYLIKPISRSMSPLGVALACAVTTAIALAVLVSNWDFQGKFLGFMAAYPVGLLVPYLVGCQVRIFDPMVAAFVGATVITPFVMTAFCCATISR
jgi:hypothetical protein